MLKLTFWYATMVAVSGLQLQADSISVPQVSSDVTDEEDLARAIELSKRTPHTTQSSQITHEDELAQGFVPSKQNENQTPSSQMPATKTTTPATTHSTAIPQTTAGNDQSMTRKVLTCAKKVVKYGLKNKKILAALFAALTGLLYNPSFGTAGALAMTGYEFHQRGRGFKELLVLSTAMLTYIAYQSMLPKPVIFPNEIKPEFKRPLPEPPIGNIGARLKRMLSSNLK